MFTVVLYARPNGPDQRVNRLRDLRGGIPERSEAILCVEQHIAVFSLKGRNEEQDYWWCRNDGDNRTQVLAIRAEPEVGILSD